MNRIEIKERAKAQLQNNIFGNSWMMALLACLIVSCITYAASMIIPAVGVIIFTGPFSFSLAYMFLKQASDGRSMDIGDTFKGFSVSFGDNFLLGLMISIFTFLWSLLFVIPGIVKAYSYSMAFYIKADHPEYNWNMCIKESQRIMNGHKMEKFVLDLSFIGWYIIGALVLGVGTLWVVPYHNAAVAQFYLALVTGNNTNNDNYTSL